MVKEKHCNVDVILDDLKTWTIEERVLFREKSSKQTELIWKDYLRVSALKYQKNEGKHPKRHWYPSLLMSAQNSSLMNQNVSLRFHVIIVFAVGNSKTCSGIKVRCPNMFQSHKGSSIDSFFPFFLKGIFTHSRSELYLQVHKCCPLESDPILRSGGIFRPQCFIAFLDGHSLRQYQHYRFLGFPLNDLLHTTSVIFTFKVHKKYYQKIFFKIF